MKLLGSQLIGIANANVFTSKGGYHYIDYLDQVEQISQIVDESELTSDLVTYGTSEKLPHWLWRR